MRCFEVVVGASDRVEPRLHHEHHLALPGVGQAVLLREGHHRPAALLEGAVLGCKLLRTLFVELVGEVVLVLCCLAGELERLH